MEQKSKAIVLQTIKYGESQLIVDIFTEKLGTLSFIVPVPKSKKAKFKRQFFQPFVILNIEFDYRPKSTLQKLKDISIAIPFVHIPFTPYKYTMVMFLSEVLAYAVKNEQQNETLFAFLLSSIVWLDHSTSNCANFHIVFLLRLSSFLGISPNMESGVYGEYFDLEAGCFVECVPVHRHYLGKEDSLHLISLLRLSYETMHLYTMSHFNRDKCIEVILEYYKIHIPNFPEIKSLTVLKELFAK